MDQFKDLSVSEKLDRIMYELVGMKTSLQSVETKLKAVEEKCSGMADEVEKVSKEVEVVKVANVKIEGRLEAMDEKIDYLENQSRRNNLVFRGIWPKIGETWEKCKEEVIELVNTKLGITIGKEDIERAHRTQGKGEPKPIVAKFKSYSVKEQILKNTNKLKDTNWFIMEDFSAKVIKERKVLLERMKDLRQNGWFATVRYNKLIAEKDDEQQIYMYDAEDPYGVKLVKTEKFGRGKRRRSGNSGFTPEQRKQSRTGEIEGEQEQQDSGDGGQDQDPLGTGRSQ